MEALGWCLLFVLVLLVPFILGMIPLKYMNSSQKTPTMAYACGWFVSFCVFELIAIPFILLQKSFTMLVIVYTLAVIILFICSFVIGIKYVIPEMIKRIRRGIKAPVYVKAGWITVVLLIATQMIYAILYEYYDGDDAYYIATSVITKTYDTMYLRDAYTGHLYPLDVRHAFATTPVYQAWLSKLTGVGPAAIAHSVLAPVWLGFMYCVFVQIGNRLLPASKNPKLCKRNYRPFFMILIIFWFAFGNVSLYTAETFVMTRTWQGKGLMAGIVIPALVLCFLNLAEEKVAKGTWIMFVTVIMSSVFATSISFMLVPTMTGVVSVLIGIKNKSVKKAVMIFVCCIPCLILGGIYLLLS